MNHESSQCFIFHNPSSITVCLSFYLVQVKHKNVIGTFPPFSTKIITGLTVRFYGNTVNTTLLLVMNIKTILKIIKCNLETINVRETVFNEKGFGSSITKPAFTCSKLKIEAPGQSVKYGRTTPAIFTRSTPYKIFVNLSYWHRRR